MKTEGWIIPPSQNGDFVAQMETYKLPYDPLYPLVCMDESSKQLIGETKLPIPAKPGQFARYDYDYEYSRKGVCNIFIATEPLMGKRIVRVTSNRKKQDWAKFLEEIERKYRHAEKITLVMDNLNTHKPGSLYETFRPKKARRCWTDLNLFIH